MSRWPDAAASLESLLLLAPDDTADLNYRLARSYRHLDDPRAKRHLLLALEAAPRFRAAQELLLKMVDDEPRKTE